MTTYIFLGLKLNLFTLLWGPGRVFKAFRADRVRQNVIALGLSYV